MPALARAYRVPLDELVGAPASGDPRVYPQPFTRDGMTVIPLTRNPGGLQVFRQILPTGGGHREPAPRARAVEFLSILGPQGERFHLRARHRPN